MWLLLRAPPAGAAAALAGPARGSGRRRPANSASASPAAAENAVLEIAQPSPLSITYATEASCVESWLSAHAHVPAFGFDTETRPSFRKGDVFAPATLQLSTATDCLVVHLTHLAAPLPGALVEVLADDAIVVAGLGIDDDAVELWLHHGLEVSGRVELLSLPGAVCRSAASNPGRRGACRSHVRGPVSGQSRGSSLAGLSEAVLGVPLGKSKRLTMTRCALVPAASHPILHPVALPPRPTPAVHLPSPGGTSGRCGATRSRTPR